MPVVNANSVDPDQMLRSAASDLGLHCLPKSYLWDTRLKRVNNIYFIAQKRFVLIFCEMLNHFGICPC